MEDIRHISTPRFESFFPFIYALFNALYFIFYLLVLVFGLLQVT